MKTRLFLAIAVLTLSASALADTDTDMSAQDMAAMSPKDVCQKLAQLDAKSPGATAQMNMFMYGSTDKTTKAMKQGPLEKEITSADCKAEVIAGNHAVVMAQAANNQQRLLPFVKQNNVWKLDVPAYRELYRMDMRTPASTGKK